MPRTLIKSRRRSPASLLLDRLGISQVELADALDVSQSSLSRVLAGKQPVPPALGPVLRAIAGPTDAEQVLDLIRAATR